MQARGRALADRNRVVFIYGSAAVSRLFYLFAAEVGLQGLVGCLCSVTLVFAAVYEIACSPSYSALNCCMKLWHY